MGRGFLDALPASFNCIVIAAKTIRRLITEWKQAQEKACKVFKNPAFNKINEKLMNAASWPLAAFILMWPLLGILIGLLVLMGQQPDALITAWTETSDWNLSQRVAPQNVYQDMHYLCTVAAGGHDKVVKPVRLGERHGHPVVVNRQLCVANAFEQILEEKHRGFIDMYVIFMTPMDFPLQKRYVLPTRQISFIS